MKKTTLAFLCAAAAVFCLPVQAQFAKPEDAIKYRQGVLFAMSQHFGRLGAMVGGRIPFDARLAADNAEIVSELSRLPWAAFAAGTDKGSTKAKPEIWAEQAKFKELSDKHIAETAKLASAAKAGNLDVLKAAFGPAAASCKACHDSFRAQ